RLRHHIHHKEIGGRPWRAHADLHALEVGGGLVARGFVLAYPDDDAGEAPELDHGPDVLTLSLHADGVLVGAGDDVDGAAHQRLQRLRAATEVVDGDVEALLFEVAKPLADRQRQIVERGLAADGEGELFLLDRLAMRGRAERKREHGERNLRVFHLVLPAV